MYAILIDINTNRILLCTYPQYIYDNNCFIVDSLPEGNIVDYLYIDNQYIYSPLPRNEEGEIIHE